MSDKTGDVDYFLSQSGLDSEREKEIGQHIGYRYDVNLVPDYERLTPFLKRYVETMGWPDLNWLEDVHMGLRGRPAGGVRPQHQRLGLGAGGPGAARQSAGPRHARPRAAGEVPDVPPATRCRTSTGCIGSSRPEVSSERFQLTRKRSRSGRSAWGEVEPQTISYALIVPLP